MLTAATPRTSKSPQRTGEFVSLVWRSVAVVALLGLAVPTGIVALLQGAGEIPLPYNLFIVDQQLPGIFRIHMLTSGLSLLLIPATLAAARYRFSWHRPLGRLTAIIVVAGAVTSFPVALLSESVAMARAGFMVQGMVWLGLLVIGVRAARVRDQAKHKRAMLGMGAVASGAIWVRMTTAVATGWDLPFDPIYACAAWLGWLLPLLLVVVLVPLPARAQTRP